MSFKQNDNDNNMIHLGNYEEYFILYMDNELSEEQVKLVDEFLLRHPDLQGEFELLMNTRLPMEEISFNKSELLANNMRTSTVDEELLLYIDNELPAEKKKLVEFELKNNKDYQFQHQLLTLSKLDPSDKVNYPNKKELYRKEERRVVAFRPWMRIAAAVVLIAVASVVYFSNSRNTSSTDSLAGVDKPKNILPKENKPSQTGRTTQQEEMAAINKGKTLSGKGEKKIIDGDKDHKAALPEELDKDRELLRNIAKANQQIQDIMLNTDSPETLRNKTPIIENKSISDVAAAEIKTPSEIINKNPVTSALANRKTEDAAAKEMNKDVASNKGSLKGFLRKTTRLIEKKTGIDPTNDGELLIGAVAINLN